MKRFKSLAVLGTGSDVGKSIVAAAICRSFADRGLNTAPFKAQNMSNNSGITPEGLEMGRAQIVQAEAARIPPPRRHESSVVKAHRRNGFSGCS